MFNKLYKTIAAWGIFILLFYLQKWIDWDLITYISIKNNDLQQYVKIAIYAWIVSSAIETWLTPIQKRNGIITVKLLAAIIMPITLILLYNTFSVIFKLSFLSQSIITNLLVILSFIMASFIEFDLIKYRLHHNLRIFIAIHFALLVLVLIYADIQNIKILHQTLLPLFK